MEKKTVEVVLCYRGRFQPFVRALAKALRALNLRVAFDREILDAPTLEFDPQREVEWTSIGAVPQEDTTWRAPLRAAVAAAEIVAFALDYPDVSENVINEMRWAILSEAHTFLLIHEGPTALEAQGLIISMLAIQYLLTTGKPDYPAFGYHFCGSLAQPALESEARTAAHRIAAYLARCREGKLETLNAATRVTVADLDKRPEARARRFLQALQLREYGGVPPGALGKQLTPMQAAREYLESREMEFASGKTPQGRIEQFRRAEEILARCQPGEHESTAYFGGLVLEAAAIEAVLHHDLRQVRPDALDFYPMVLIGTVPYTNALYPWAARPVEDFRVLIVDATFIDFLYQLLKVSVTAAARAGTDRDGRPVVNLEFEHLSDALTKHRELREGAYRCIRDYAVNGKPGASLEGPPEPICGQPLSAWVRVAERALLALGYAAFTLHGAPWPPPPMRLAFNPKEATLAQKQALQDTIALDYCIRARRLIDDADPVQAIAGMFATLSVVHIRQRMLAVLNPGSRKWNLEGPEQIGGRLNALLQFVNHQMAEAGAPEDWRRKALEQSWLAGTAPLKLWTCIEPELRADAGKGIKPLAAWG